MPIHHGSKKGYYVALRRAWFMFEPKSYADLIAALKADGLTEKEIEAKEYFDFPFFRKRVPRMVPPPSLHYSRVRAVFALYGQQRDSKTGAPLFNHAAWTKANNVLDEILEGHAADPPGVQVKVMHAIIVQYCSVLRRPCYRIQFYFQTLDSRGEPAFDEHGIALIDCNRGTNDVENSHKQIITTFGTWCTGVAMANFLLAERRHRYNHNVSERRRNGFPKLGHFDTWLIDVVDEVLFKNYSAVVTLFSF